jgi:hypothetical protein
VAAEQRLRWARAVCRLTQASRLMGRPRSLQEAELRLVIIDAQSDPNELCLGLYQSNEDSSLEVLPAQPLVDLLLNFEKRHHTPSKILSKFGNGIGDVFMQPYNVKVWAHDPFVMNANPNPGRRCAHRSAESTGGSGAPDR